MNIRKSSAIIFLSLFCQIAIPCSFTEQTTDASYSASSKVFTGFLQSAELYDINDSSKLKLVFEVEEIFKGEVGAYETIYTGFGGGDCGLGAPFGERILLYVNDAGEADIVASRYLLKKLVHLDERDFEDKFDFAGKEKEIYEALLRLKASNTEKQAGTR